jgi:hypothetical protein
MLSQADCIGMTMMFMAESEHARKAKAERLPNLAYIDLNNLYLKVQNGHWRLTITRANTLRLLVDDAYPDRVADEVIREWWMGQLQKLPRWLDC